MLPPQQRTLPPPRVLQLVLLNCRHCRGCSSSSSASSSSSSSSSRSLWSIRSVVHLPRAFATTTTTGGGTMSGSWRITTTIHHYNNNYQYHHSTLSDTAAVVAATTGAAHGSHSGGTTAMAAAAANTATTTTTTAASTAAVTPPTTDQFRRVFWKAALPMVGFGFMDQTVMLQAGHAIDCTLGVTFGLSTLTAAAFGQVCSDASGVMFGNTLDRLASRLGLPSSGLDAAQRSLPAVKRVKFAGTLIGVISGCILGLLNLLLIDTERSSTLKLQALSEGQEFEFLVEASNAVRKDVTALTVTGPDVDGILASMTAALALRGCSLVELHAKRKIMADDTTANSTDGTVDEDDDIDGDRHTKDAPSAAVQDVFYVVDRETGQPYEDEELEDLARGLLDATRTPMNAIGVKTVISELEKSNHALKQRVTRLEEVVKAKQITIVPKPGEGEPFLEK